MGRSKSPDNAPRGSQQAPHEIDRHKSLKEAVTAVGNDFESPDAQVERVEIDVSAAGEVTYRVWRARSDEAEGGYVYEE